MTSSMCLSSTSEPPLWAQPLLGLCQVSGFGFLLCWSLMGEQLRDAPLWTQNQELWTCRLGASL